MAVSFFSPHSMTLAAACRADFTIPERSSAFTSAAIVGVSKSIPSMERCCGLELHSSEVPETPYYLASVICTASMSSVSSITGVCIGAAISGRLVPLKKRGGFVMWKNRVPCGRFTSPDGVPEVPGAVE